MYQSQANIYDRQGSKQGYCFPDHLFRKRVGNAPGRSIVKFTQYLRRYDPVLIGYGISKYLEGPFLFDRVSPVVCIDEEIGIEKYLI